MEKDRLRVLFIIRRRDGSSEERYIDIPADITANELVIGLNRAYNLGINTEDINECYFCAEYPTVLLRGNKPLSEYNIMNGTKIRYTERAD